MKTVKLFAALLLCALTASCSQDDSECSGTASEITAYYANEIQKVVDAADEGEEPDARKIGLLEKERDNKLAKACN